MKDLLIFNPERIFLPFTYDEISAESQNNLHLMQDLSIVVKNGSVHKLKNTRSVQNNLSDYRVVDATGKSVTPGFVDSHTHLVYAGQRSEEFEMRARGTTYLELLESGNGINRTVRETRNCSPHELTHQSLQRLMNHVSNGVTTVEIKTGYGLELKSEDKMLRTMESMEKISGIKIIKTLLPLHAVPPDTNRNDYLELAENQILPALYERADFVDSFCDTGAFSVEETEHFFHSSTKYGLPYRLHADEIDRIGALGLSKKFKISSVDHLLHSTLEDIISSHSSGTIPTVLPGTAFSLGEKYAEAGNWIRDGIPVGVASDISPLSPVCDMKFHGNLAIRFCGMTPNAVFNGMTSIAAHSLGIDNVKGNLREGMDADMLISDIRDVRDMFYNWSNVKFTVISKGRLVNTKKIMAKSIIPK